MRICFDKYDEMLSLKDLKASKHQRNKHPREQIERLAKIMSEHGVRHPISISKLSGEVCFGHGRWEAAKLNKWKEFPVIYQDFKDEIEEYTCVQSDNPIAFWSELDLSSINSDLPDMGPDFDIDLLGIKDFVLEPAEKVDPGCDEDEVPDVVEPKTKPGDIYILGRHRLMCGDSTSVDHVGRLMGDQLADLVFTDPPYGVSYDGGHANDKRREKLANDDSTQIYDDSVPLMFAFSKPTSALYLWFAATKSLQVLQVLQANNYAIRSWLIWNKNLAQFGAIGAQYKQKHEPCLYCFKMGNAPYWNGPNNEVSVWDVSRAAKNEFHPTQKPVELAERALTNSCVSAGIVLDLFGGSGATLIAAEKSNRSGRLMELDPRYCDVIVARWEKYTGQKAEITNG